MVNSSQRIGDCTVVMTSEEILIRNLPSLIQEYKECVPISELAIKNAAKFIENIFRRKTVELSNTCDGSVKVEIITDTGYEVWDFYSDGGVALMIEAVGKKYFFDATEEFNRVNIL
jgi:hypothetical protein